MNAPCRRGHRRVGRAISLWVAAMLTGVVGCAQNTSQATASATELRFDGRVVRVELEGGFWGLAAHDGAHYDPIDLPRRYRQEGLQVRVVARKVDIASFHMWGTPVRIITIEPLP